MKKTLVCLFLGGLLVGALGAASAQTGTTEPVQKPTTVKLGILLPADATGRHYAGSPALSAGVDYAFEKTADTNPTLPSIYLDYNGGSGNGGHIYTYGAGLAVRTYGSAPSGATAQKVSPYFGAGLGVYYIDARNTYETTSGSGESAVTTTSHTSGTSTGFGGKVFGGLEFSQSFLVELNYQWLPGRFGINPSGLGLQGGVRF